MGPYNALLGILAFVAVLTTIGVLDIRRQRREARKHERPAQ
jgi:hypothetical protein